MPLTLIGMSNIGKTHWARRLEQEGGFTRIDCDAMVEQKLGVELTGMGYAGIGDVARWMGQPFDGQYGDTSRRFVECERKVMLEVIASVRSARINERIVIDTCGSVIYTGEDIAAALQEITTVVYLAASDEHVSRLFTRYFEDPKPLIWGKMYAPRSGEKPIDALARCYPELLKYRASCYQALCHVKCAFEEHRDPSAGIGLLTAETL